MTAGDFERVRELFLAARELDAAQRREYLDRACANDPDARSEVEALLAHEDEASGLMDVPSQVEGLRSGLERVLQTAEPEPVPQRIGRYTILGTLGEGGMGIVYLAEQESPRRKVALKVVRTGGILPSLLRRFEHEASILGQLAHPGIAQIHEAGVADVQTEGGLTTKWPFFAMEYVPGEPLGQYAANRKPSVTQRLELIASICDAVHHAHQQGVVHRDLKPSNILVDEQGRAKILDFGVARLTDADMQTVTMQTAIGQLVGTIPYMSPEQVTGVSANIDTRSDVYALGVICYELLTGNLPYNVHGRSIPEAARVIREEEPTRLSRVNSLFRGDLDTIITKALEKDKARRYQSASELAADLRNYLENRPITARPPTTLYQLRMFTRRNTALVSGVLATFLALLIGIAGISFQATRATQERNRALNAEQLADRRRDLAERRAYAANIAAAHAALSANDVANCRQRLEAAPPKLRNWEWRYLANRMDVSVATLTSHQDFVWSVAYAPDGDWLASASADGTVKLWDASTGREQRSIDTASGPLRSVDIAPDGRRLLTAARDGPPQVWNSSTGEELMSLPGHVRGTTNASYSPDGAFIATASIAGVARLWDARTGALLAVLEHPNWVHDVCFTPDSTRLVTSCRDNLARIWDVSTHGLLVKVQVLPSSAEWDIVHGWGIALDPHGLILATGGHDGVIRLWSVETGDLMESLTGHTRRVRALAFSPDGTRLASTSDDQTVRIWDPAAGLELTTLLGHEDGVFGVDFSPDGMRLASASADHTVRIWGARAGPQVDRIWGHDNRGFRALDISPDGRRFVSGGEDSAVGLWDVESGAQLAILRGHEDWVRAVEFSPDATLALSGSRDGSVRLWNVATGAEVAVLRGHEGDVRAVVFLENGRRAASAAMDGTIRIWDLTARSQLLALTGGEDDRFTALACSPDGSQLASGTELGRVDFWDVRAAHRVSASDAHAGTVWQVAYSRDGALLVSASEDATLKLWSARTGDLVATLRGHGDDVSGAAFSPDGTRIASVSFDHSVRLWDLATYETVLSFNAHHSWPFRIAFSPDGTWLASSARSIRIWRTTSSASRITE